MPIYPMKINDKGVALIVVMLILVALAILASGVIMITTTEIFVSRNDVYSKEALYAAEAGIHYATRALTQLNSLQQIEEMYQADGSAYTDCDRFNDIPVGHKFLYASPDTNTWVWGALDTAHPELTYKVYIENDELVNGAPSSKETNGIFLVRSVGFSPMGARRIIEVMFYSASAVGLDYDQLGGGSRNITPIRVSQ